ncbi:right-handed parallel beta-helix repeat-containing protein [Fodinicola feengrottensis]|uniref:right-handed parallel beta-helix repeat-containing protein n=1 Tax=Fodinicola feengrottensis TaxID=435914 RepID=UPI0013D0AB8D|nr:right-handed parallel beta-helix repeat-containing protein [Fodinicola feengrottensis]
MVALPQVAMAAVLAAVAVAAHGSEENVGSAYGSGDGSEKIAVGKPNIAVSTTDELVAALAAATPGQTIDMAPGHYDGNFFATRKGTAGQPITLTGPRTAVLSNSAGKCDPGDGDIKFCGYGMHLHGADYWNLTGFAVSDAAKGIVLDGSSHVVIDRVEVSDVDSEAIHLRGSSSDNVISDSVVHDTGRTQPQYGEAIYLGSAKKNHWDEFGVDGGPDRSDRNQVIGDHLGPNVAAEEVDIKEGTTGGVVKGNTFDGHGISGQNAADSWIDVKGDGYQLSDNTGTYDGVGSLVDGYQVHQAVDGWGCQNAFVSNSSDLGGAGGYAIDVTDQKKCDQPNVVYASNTVKNAGSGLTNITVTN